MLTVIGFDIAALLVCFSLGIVLFVNRILPTKQTKIYIGMLVLMVLASVSSLVENLLFRNPAFSRSFILLLFVFLNYFTFTSISCFYLKFIVFSAKSKYDLNLIEKLAVNVPQVLVLVLSLPCVYYKVFVFTPETLHDTVFNYFLYGITAFNMIFALVYIIIHINEIGKRKFSMVCVYTATIFAIVLVYVFSYILILNFAVSLGLVFLMLSIQDPNTMLDEQTKSFNAKAFEVTCKDWFSRKKAFSVAGILLRNKGFINEKYGVETGTKVLEKITPVLKKVISDSYVFHFRETSFMILGDNITEKNISDIVEKLSSELLVHGLNVRLDVGSFIIRFPEIFRTESEMYRIINFMINSSYQSKSRDVFVADEDFLKKFVYEENVSVAIKQAVRDKSFKVFYQPILNQRTGKFDTAEALARLVTDDLGFIPPDSFIPKAEKTGEIIEIGKIILDKVCRFIVLSRPEKYGVKNIKVNLSVVQCMQHDMSRELISIIDSYGISHDMINFEITESLADNADLFFRQNVADLRSAGFKFSLDDYGTGYSNMTRMISFHFDVLKLDKSIVWMAEEKWEAMISLRGTVEIANGINMAVLAEGVETEKQADFLRDAGVAYFQGYLYSKPIPENDYMEFLKANFTA